MTDPRDLLLVGTGPGLGAAIAHRFAREGYRPRREALSPLFAASGAPDALTIPGQIAPRAPFDPKGIADVYWAIGNERTNAWSEEYRFAGAEQPAVAA